MAKSTEKQVVFAFAPSKDGSPPTILVGLTRAAWHHMDLGNSHAFSLAKIGLPVDFMLFSGKDHDAVMKTLFGSLASAGVTVDDRRRENFVPEPTIRPEMIEAARREGTERGLDLTDDDAREILRAGMKAP